MLVNDKGEHWGQITGGCAEAALIEHALLALKAGQDKTHRYGLNSPFFDIQLPCGSGVDVVFDVSRSAAEYQSLVSALDSRQAAILQLDWANEQFAKHYFPNERLMIFGQGRILASLLSLAYRCNYETVAIVQDEADLKIIEQYGFEGVLLSSVGSDYSQLLDQYTAVVSLFHEHEREGPILQQALSSDVFYVGALGSQRTQAQRLQMLAEMGVEEAQLARIHGPVGLDIKAETPAQIAVSILAQVMAYQPKSRNLNA